MCLGLSWGGTTMKKNSVYWQLATCSANKKHKNVWNYFERKTIVWTEIWSSFYLKLAYFAQISSVTKHNFECVSIGVQRTNQTNRRYDSWKAIKFATIGRHILLIKCDNFFLPATRWYHESHSPTPESQDNPYPSIYSKTQNSWLVVKLRIN